MTATEEKWAERVRRWRESGVSARAYATGQGFSAGGLRHWAYRLKKRGAETAKAPERAMRLARVERAAPAASAEALVVEVGVARLHVRPGADAVTLRTTLSALFDAARGGAR